MPNDVRVKVLGVIALSLIGSLSSAGAARANHCEAETTLVAGAEPWTLAGELTRDDDTISDLGLHLGWGRTESATYGDVYCFTLTEYGDVEILQESTSNLRPHVHLYEHDPMATNVYDEFRELVDDQEASQQPISQAPLTAYFLAPGNYAIIAGSFWDDDDGLFRGNPAGAVGSYTVSTSLTGVNPMCASRTPLAFGETAMGSLAPGDCTWLEMGHDHLTGLVDLYELWLDVPGFVTIQMDAPEFDADFEVRGEPYPGRLGDLRVGSERNGWWSGWLPGGSYTVVAASEDDLGAGDYTLSFDYDPPNAAACEVTEPIALDTTVQGALEVDDCPMPELGLYWASFVDLYQFTLPRETVIEVAMLADADEGRVEADVQIYAYDPSWPIGGGFVAAADEIFYDEFGEHANISPLALAAGTYVVLAHDDDAEWFEEWGRFEQGAYSLTVSTAPEPAAALRTGAALAAMAVLARRGRRPRAGREHHRLSA